MKKLTHLLTFGLLAAIITSCAAVKTAKQQEREKTQQTAKDALREFVNEGKKNREKYNVTCNYTDQPGQILITKIESAKDNLARVFYDFRSSTLNAGDETYKLGSKNRVLLINGRMPTKAWCDSKGVRPGAIFAATRKEIVPGYKTEYCDQFSFEIPSLMY